MAWFFKFFKNLFKRGRQRKTHKAPLHRRAIIRESKETAETKKGERKSIAWREEKDRRIREGVRQREHDIRRGNRSNKGAV